MRQPDQYLEHPDLSTSHHSSRTFTGYLSIGESYTRLLHCHSSLSGSGPQYLCDLTHAYTPARSLRSSSDTRILSTPNVKLKSHGQRSFAYHGPTTWIFLPLALIHQQESDCFKRALKAHLSINELNTSVVFCYFHLPTINTTLVVNKLRHLSYY